MPSPPAPFQSFPIFSLQTAQLDETYQYMAPSGARHSDSGPSKRPAEYTIVRTSSQGNEVRLVPAPVTAKKEEVPVTLAASIKIIPPVPNYLYVAKTENFGRGYGGLGVANAAEVS